MTLPADPDFIARCEAEVKCDRCGAPGTSHYDAAAGEFVCKADRELDTLLDRCAEKDAGDTE